MRNLRQVVAIFGLSVAAFSPALDQSAFATQTEMRSGTQLETLVEPIALYPDNLLAAMLQASTFPDQIIDAGLLITNEKEAERIAKQKWDNSVKVVASYPGVLKLMFDKITWTKELGSAVLAQHKEVLDAIQRMRGKAMAQGNLESNEHQKVATQKAPNGSTVITVAPADPEVVYVPTYTNSVVYEEPSSSSALVPLASFGLGVALGAAMDDDDDHYYYGGWGGPSYWYNDNVDHWLDNRREVWEDYNDRRWDKQEFRQDMISEGKWPAGSEARRDQTKQQAQQRAQTWKQNNPEKSQQLASARSNRQSMSDTAGSGGSFSRSGKGFEAPAQRSYSQRSPSSYSSGSSQLYPRSSTNNPFQGYGSSRTSASAYSSRGSYSRGSAGFGGSRSGFSGASRGGGGGFSRGGGGRGGGRR